MLRRSSKKAYGCRARQSAGAFIRGVEPAFEARVSEVSEKMLSGKLTDLRPGEYNIILGLGLASRLQVGPGDKVTVIAPRLKATPVGASPLMRRFTRGRRIRIRRV